MIARMHDMARRDPPALPAVRSRAWPRRVARAALAAADAVCCALTPWWVRETPGLVVLALHSLCAERSQLDEPSLAPGQNMCVDDLRALVEVMLASGYRLVSPEQVAAGLSEGGKYAMLTFDDGYYNNVLALEVLAEFDVPATFFISSAHVLQEKAFWWDAVSRELARGGLRGRPLALELARLKQLPPEAIERAVCERFGPGALRPRGDGDRPFTAAELADFARDARVHLGNHTADHAILTRCAPAEMRRQIDACQSALHAITGRRPIAIAYPNGNHSAAVLEAARAAGLQLGFTVRPVKNHLPEPADAALRLGRFYVEAGRGVARQFHACCGGFVPSRLARTILQPA